MDLMRQLLSSGLQLLLILILIMLLLLLLSRLRLQRLMLPLFLLPLLPLLLIPLLLGERRGKHTALGVAKLPHQPKHIASNYSEKLHSHPHRFQLPSLSS
jgi:cell division protein FtsW (lipid II flippase)